MKLLIADDHSLLAECIKDKLSELKGDVEFTIATSVQNLFLTLETFPDIDMALIDLIMPGASDGEHVHEIRRRWPDLKIIVLSGIEDPEVIGELLLLGIRGYIPKAYSSGVMLSAVRLVQEGGVYVPPIMLTGMIKSAPQSTSGYDTSVSSALLYFSNPRSTDVVVSLDKLRALLTERQLDVLHLLSEGKPNKQIARELKISEGTAKIHLAAIFRALSVRNRTEAVIAYQKLT